MVDIDREANTHGEFFIKFFGQGGLKLNIITFLYGERVSGAFALLRKLGTFAMESNENNSGKSNH